MSKISRILFVNVTRQCNVNCPRCYISEEKRNTKELLSIDLLEKALDDPFYTDPNVNPVLIYEGGELSLIGEKKLREMLELAKRKLPHVKQTMVANCYSLPDWLINLCKEYMDGAFETTYALDRKYSLDGDADKYQKKFIASAKKAIDKGIDLVVNVELNKETFEKGVDELMKIIRETKIKVWEFDQSVYFDKFLENPKFNMWGSPELECTTTYEQFSDFMIELAEKHGDELNELGIQIGAIQQAIYNEETIFFNVKGTANMISVNADGSCTTDVLYTDIPQMFIGNLHNQTISQMLESKNRKMLLRYENIERTKTCHGCEFYEKCKGGPSYMPMFDGKSDECAGCKKVWQYMKEKYKGNYNQRNFK